jgi:hypothetical protein
MPNAIAPSSSGGLALREDDITMIEVGGVGGLLVRSYRPGVGTRTSF